VEASNQRLKFFENNAVWDVLDVRSADDSSQQIAQPGGKSNIFDVDLVARYDREMRLNGIERAVAFNAPEC
jgi:hypothetical protein